MLVDIYARTMLNATRHADLPLRPLPAPYVLPPRKPGRLRRAISALTQAVGHLRARMTTASASGACGPAPQPCK